MRLSSIFLVFCALFMTLCANAQSELQLFRKIAVFPISDANFQSSEDAWWQMREAVTRHQKFLVASRRFMINRGVFQPRRELKPADVIVLGKILDAEALVVSQVIDRKFRLFVYQSEDGRTLWKTEVELHPALPVAEQLGRVSLKAMQDFLLSLPYQGFQVPDENSGKIYLQEEGETRAWVFHGLQSGLELGDKVEWIEYRSPGFPTMIQANNQTEVVAEGEVREIKGNLAFVRVTRMKDPKVLKENALIRFPRELSKLKAQYVTDDRASSLTSEYLSSELKEPAAFEKGHNTTSTALGFIGNMALLLLLAL